jgi:hypothetical protein
VIGCGECSRRRTRSTAYRTRTVRRSRRRRRARKRSHSRSRVGLGRVFEHGRRRYFTGALETCNVLLVLLHERSRSEPRSRRPRREVLGCGRAEPRRRGRGVHRQSLLRGPAFPEEPSDFIFETGVALVRSGGATPCPPRQVRATERRARRDAGRWGALSGGNLRCIEYGRRNEHRRIEYVAEEVYHARKMGCSADCEYATRKVRGVIRIEG